MKNRRFIDAKVMGILRQAESSVPVTELCREHGISNASFLQMALEVLRYGRFNDG